MRYTYIKMENPDKHYYIVTYDYMGNKIDVSKPYKTKNECLEQYNKILAFPWIKERK